MIDQKQSGIRDPVERKYDTGSARCHDDDGFDVEEQDEEGNEERPYPMQRSTMNLQMHRLMNDRNTAYR